jgi:hypothetical protein
MLIPTNEAVVIVESADFVIGFAIQNVDAANDIWISPSQEGLNRMPTVAGSTLPGALGNPALVAPQDDVDAIAIVHNGGSFSPPVPFCGKLYARALNANAVIRKIVWRATTS